MIPLEFLGVPLTERFVFRDVELRVLDHTPLRPRHTPTDAVVYCRLLRRYGDRERLTGTRMHYNVHVDGRHTMTVQISSTLRSPGEWDALRAARRADAGLPTRVGTPCPPPPRIAAPTVGRYNPYNVVISELSPGLEGRRTARLVVDTSHPTMFDHPLDHVPGMLELEAFRQLTVAAVRDAAGPLGPSWQLLALSGHFLNFVELDLPAVCDVALEAPACPDSDLTARCTMRQGNRCAATANLQLAGAGPKPVDDRSLSLKGLRS